jgi:hypothetical protein
MLHIIIIIIYFHLCFLLFTSVLKLFLSPVLACNLCLSCYQTIQLMDLNIIITFILRIKILSRVSVTKDGVRIGDCV